MMRAGTSSLIRPPGQQGQRFRPLSAAPTTGGVGVGAPVLPGIRQAPDEPGATPQPTPGLPAPTNPGAPPPAPVPAVPALPGVVPAAGGFKPNTTQVDPGTNINPWVAGQNPVQPQPPIDPGAPTAGNLRGDVYAPGSDPRLTSAQSATDAAYQGLNGPNRTELAKKALADFQQQGEKDLAARYRTVGQQASKFGQMGLGDVNARLGTIAGDYEQQRLAKENELASSVAEGDIGDRFRKVSAASGLEGQAYGEGAGNRSEMRTERGYQQGAAQQSLENRIQERAQQNQEMTQRHLRAIALMQASGGTMTLEQALASMGG